MSFSKKKKLQLDVFMYLFVFGEGLIFGKHIVALALIIIYLILFVIYQNFLSYATYHAL